MKHGRLKKKGGDNRMMVKGFIISDLPVVFETSSLVAEARFPSQQPVTPYLEEDATQLDEQLDETN